MNSSDTQTRQTVLIPVSLGELVDRISILEIKQQHMSDPGRLANVERELALLNRVLQQHGRSVSDPQMAPLREVNNALWELENRVRQLERDGVFGRQYVAIAREIHRSNDIRHELKRSISLGGDSLLVEEKEYSTSP